MFLLGHSVVLVAERYCAIEIYLIITLASQLKPMSL